MTTPIIQTYELSDQVTLVLCEPASMNLWDTSHVLSVVNGAQPLFTYKLPKCRHYLGSHTISNTFLYVSALYYNNIPIIRVDFYRVELTADEKCALITKTDNVYEFNASCSSLGECSGKLSKINDIFTLVWGDFTNDQTFNYAVFTKLEQVKTDYNTPIPDFIGNETDILDVCFIMADYWVESVVYAYDYNQLRIEFHSNNPLAVAPKFAHYHHRYHCEEVKSQIIEFGTFSTSTETDAKCCILMVLLEKNVNTLQIEEYIVYILFNISKNCIIEHGEQPIDHNNISKPHITVVDNSICLAL
jgi:hypothetical protein